MPNMIQRLILRSMTVGRAMSRREIENGVRRHTQAPTVIHGFYNHMEAMPDRVRHTGNKWKRLR